MMTSPFPQNYAEWQHCITVECNIPLTAEFVEARLKVWKDESCEETRRFRKRYGDDYWRSVISWFEQAAGELA
ncbi:MAG: hypothetical protein AAF671_06505 [Pseudomonadota bacterium]